MSTVSRIVARIMNQAGWFNGRHIDTSEYEKMLRSEGYHVFPAVTEFLSQFGGLYFENPDAQPPAPEDWHFDVKAAVKHAFPTNLYLYGRRLGDEVCLIGEASRDHLVLMMDGSGRVFGGYDQVLLYIGSSGLDSIIALCEGRQLTPLKEDEPSADK